MGSLRAEKSGVGGELLRNSSAGFLLKDKSCWSGSSHFTPGGEDLKGNSRALKA